MIAVNFYRRDANNELVSILFTDSEVITNKELLSNKSTDVVTDAYSDTKYPSVRSIKNYADDLFRELTYVPNALGYVSENTVNKSTNLSEVSTVVEYPTSKTTFDFVKAETLRASLVEALTGTDEIKLLTPYLREFLMELMYLPYYGANDDLNMGAFSVTANSVNAGNGATGSFISGAKTITVVNGIITNIV